MTIDTIVHRYLHQDITAAAGIKLLRQLDANIVESCFVVDLPDIGGSKKLRDELNCPVFALCEFEGD